MATREQVSGDRRMQRTRRRLQQALWSLAREKDYDAITVKDILDRADIGRSTFYVHYENKDALLDSSIRAVIEAVPVSPLPDHASGPERIVRFSLPFLEQVHDHMQEAQGRLGTHGRAVLHERLRMILADAVGPEISKAWRGRMTPNVLSASLLARHVASAFVLVLDAWAEGRSRLAPARVDDQFRALVMPILEETCGRGR